MVGVLGQLWSCKGNVHQRGREADLEQHAAHTHLQLAAGAVPSRRPTGMAGVRCPRIVLPAFHVSATQAHCSEHFDRR